MWGRAMWGLHCLYRMILVLVLGLVHLARLHRRIQHLLYKSAYDKRTTIYKTVYDLHDSRPRPNHSVTPLSIQSYYTTPHYRPLKTSESKLNRNNTITLPQPSSHDDHQRTAHALSASRINSSSMIPQDQPSSSHVVPSWHHARPSRSPHRHLSGSG